MDKNITGMMVYYYFVCHRKLWYFAKGLNMEQNSQNVAIGKVLDETTYKRDDKHINIENSINIDYIKELNEIHEVKKSKAIEEASIWQVKYYIYFLREREIFDVVGKIDYPLLKEIVEVTLNDEDIIQMTEIIKNIKDLINSDLPPTLKKKPICKNCAYYDLCFI